MSGPCESWKQLTQVESAWSFALVGGRRWKSATPANPEAGRDGGRVIENKTSQFLYSGRGYPNLGVLLPC